MADVFFPFIYAPLVSVVEINQVGRANAFKARIEQYVDSTKVGLAFIARSSTKREDEDEEVHKHCIGDVRG